MSLGSEIGSGSMYGIDSGSEIRSGFDSDSEMSLTSGSSSCTLP